jgi:ABC-type amino acid transport substrate-binding protein
MMRSAHSRCLRLAYLAALLIIAGGSFGGAASAGTLDRIGQDRTLRMPYREDARPFSYKDQIGQPAGFMVDLCREVAKKLAKEQNLTPLNVTYVAVTAADRFEAIRQQKADLLCEPTSATLSRRELVDFSIATFVDGASLMIRADGPHDLQAMSGKKIAVLTGTTTEQGLRDAVAAAGISADIVPAKTHAEGLSMLDDGKISAYFGDRSILVSLIKDSRASGKLTLAENYLSVELYALALLHGDDDFRLAVDRALSHIYRSGEISAIFKRTFGAKPAQVLKTLYLITGLPD